MNIEDSTCSYEDDFAGVKFLNGLIKGVRNIYVLWLISKGKIHGYAIISKLNEVTKELPKVKKVHGSTIYPLLYSLENDGLIISCEELNGKHKVKRYEITEKGLKLLDSIKQFKNKELKNDLFFSFIDEMMYN